MKKQLNTAIAALFLATASMTAMAAEDASKGYFGISYGDASTDTGITGLTGTASLDEDKKGAKLFAGFNVNDNFAIEGHYSDFGEASLSGNNGDQFVDDGVTYEFLTTATIKIKVKSYGLAGVYKFDKINEVIYSSSCDASDGSGLAAAASAATVSGLFVDASAGNA